jgi:hypothetical protein
VVRDIPAVDAAALVAIDWMSALDGLHVRLRDPPEEIRLECRCGRFHWIVREAFLPAGGQLIVTCHHCGTRVTMPYETTPTHAHRGPDASAPSRSHPQE